MNPQSQPARELTKLAGRRRELLAQQRDQITQRDSAQADVTQLGRDIKHAEARAYALGNDAPDAKGRARLRKLASQVEDLAATAEKVALAITALDDEVRAVTINNAGDLLQEASEQHDDAQERVAELVNELHAQRAMMLDAYTTAQRILATAGLNMTAGGLCDTPTVEAMVSDGGAPALFADPQRMAEALVSQRADLTTAAA